MLVKMNKYMEMLQTGSMLLLAVIEWFPVMVPEGRASPEADLAYIDALVTVAFSKIQQTHWEHHP